MCANSHSKINYESFNRFAIPNFVRSYNTNINSWKRKNDDRQSIVRYHK